MQCLDFAAFAGQKSAERQPKGNRGRKKASGFRVQGLSVWKSLVIKGGGSCLKCPMECHSKAGIFLKGTGTLRNTRIQVSAKLQCFPLWSRQLFAYCLSYVSEVLTVILGKETFGDELTPEDSYDLECASYLYRSKLNSSQLDAETFAQSQDTSRHFVEVASVVCGSWDRACRRHPSERPSTGNTAKT